MRSIKLFQQKNSENMNNVVKNLSKFLTINLRELLQVLPGRISHDIEEIRIRVNRPLILCTNYEQLTIRKDKVITTSLHEGYIVTKEELGKLLMIISQSSIYAWEEEFKRGYLTLPGGHRVGLVGKAVLSKGEIKTLKDISSLNFRVAKELKGIADHILPYIVKNNRVEHTLIVSPPRCGKTTLLRDLVRQLSNGNKSLNFLGVNIGLVDERSEIAGMYNGTPQYDVGIRTDILDSCPKAQGMIMLVRSMAPQVIATDEIGTIEDIKAMEEVLNSGTSLLTTVHASDMEELKRRPNLHKILEKRIFTRIIILSRSLGIGTIENIIDGFTYKNLINKPIKGRVSLN